MLHFTLSKLPPDLDIEALVARTTSLFAQHPPNSLPSRAWTKVSANSVLKTTQDPDALASQTLRDGEMYLTRHAAEIERAEARQKMLQQARLTARKYRRPASAVTLAVLVGVLSLWLGRSGQGASALGTYAALAGVKQRVVDMFWYLVPR